VLCAQLRCALSIEFLPTNVLVRAANVLTRKKRLTKLHSCPVQPTAMSGPEAPKGFEKNWIQTVPGRAWFAYLRLYGSVG
jgi:hypothetical protein